MSATYNPKATTTNIWAKRNGQSTLTVVAKGKSFMVQDAEVYPTKAAAEKQLARIQAAMLAYVQTGA
jgi:hypothetical protein